MFIKLYGKRAESKNLYAIIDDEDFDLVSKYKWIVDNRNRVQTGIYVDGRNKTLRMHRLITHTQNPKIIIDHKNHNTLDNRKSNLRICEARHNCYNRYKITKVCTSKYKGVSKASPNRFKARINYYGKQILLGYYLTELQAAIAYDNKAKELFGEFAHLNFNKESVNA